MTEPQHYTADFVVPCFNEEAVLPITIPRACSYIDGLKDNAGSRLQAYRILLIDDGSADGTWGMIEALASRYPQVAGLKLSRNFGHQAALLAGLSHARADAVISMDADFQDDINAVQSMFAAYEDGVDLALGVRADRRTDTALKRIPANLYYRLLRFLGVPILPNHADYRLMSRRALLALLEHEEVNLFLRGLIPSLGFSVRVIPYSRQHRVAGTSKYTLRKMARLAVDGVTSFSVAPLRLIALVGAAVFVASAAIGIHYLIQRLWFPETTVPGWASTLLPLLFMGGLQMLSIGVLGEYVGKIYMETKRRPRFIVERGTDNILARN